MLSQSMKKTQTNRLPERLARVIIKEVEANGSLSVYTVIEALREPHKIAITKEDLIQEIAKYSPNVILDGNLLLINNPNTDILIR